MKNRFVVLGTALGALLLASSARPLTAQLNVLTGWEGITSTQFHPPDSHGGAGPEGIITTVNVAIGYRRFDGTSFWGPMDLADFMAPNGNSRGGNFDPKAMYDALSGRFYVIVLEDVETDSYLNVAVSKTSHPRSSGTADWYFYRVLITTTDDTLEYGGDYPGLGIDGQGVYVSLNMYSLPLRRDPPSTFYNVQIVTLDKSALNSGTLIYKRHEVSEASTYQPVSVLGAANPGNVAYFVTGFGPTSIRVSALTDPLGSPMFSSMTVTVPNIGIYSAKGVPQPNSGTLLDYDGRMQGNAFWHNGSIWACHTAGGTPSQVAYYRINANNYPGGTPTLGESGRIDGGPGVWTFLPAIGGNARGDVCLVYCQSSVTQFPSIMCTARRAENSAFPSPITLRVSPNSYNGDVDEDNVARWGDYGTVCADPFDGTFWVCHEFARSTGNDDWSTWWPNVNLWGLGNVLYVNGSFAGGSPNGSASRPFPRVGLANQAALGGTLIRIASGSYPETLTFNRSLRLEARGGPVTIGQ